MTVKKRKFSWSAWLVGAAAVICAAAVLVPVAFGDNITSSDPLISFSYLNGIFKTDLMSTLEDTIDAEVEELNKDLTKKISGVRDAIGNVSSPSSTHGSVSVAAGTTHTVSANSEFLVISGSAAAKEAGLLDVTTGLTVAQGEPLLENHLYIAVSRVGITAETATKLLVRK